MSIEQHLQQTYLGAYVELFDIDLTVQGGSTLHFVSGTMSNAPIQWGGNTYLPIPMEFTGNELTSVGQEPTPTIKFSNVDRILMNEILALGDLVGGKVTRRRTFSQFLDNGATPDPSMELPPDKFIISKNTMLSPTEIVYKLMTELDNNNLMIPRRQVLRDSYKAKDGETYQFPGITRIGSRRSY